MHGRLLRFNDRLRSSTLASFLEVWAAPLGLVVLMLTIWASSYGGRVQIRENVLAGCVRGQVQRAGDVELNTDLAAFIALAEIRAQRAGDYDIDGGYKTLEDRAHRRAAENTRVLVVCSEVNKPPSLIEFHVLTPKPQPDAERKFVPRPLPANVQHLLDSAPTH